jgi:chromosome segregation ATPase
MRVRHKVPQLFSLSMVDVLCCALGCVILMWLLNARQSDEDVEEIRQDAASRLAAAQRDQDAQLAAARREQSSQMASARSEQEKLRKRIAALLTDREKAAGLQARLEEEIRTLTDARRTLQTGLASQQTRARDLEAKLKTSSARVIALEADVRTGTTKLEAERKKAGNLSTRLDEAETKLKELRGDLARADARMRSERDRADGLRRTIENGKRDLAAVNRSLEDAQKAKSALEKSLAQRDKELTAARLYKDRAEAAEERERFLAKQLKDRAAAMDQATRTLAALEKEKRALRVKEESRFAGIALTGKRVIFLVDMSGSMDYVDENTRAPEKWAEVRSTVARLLRSLPELEKYQVITFAAKSDFPLGSAGKWLENDKDSADKVLRALAAIKPEGGTNMYTALEAAFRYRADGLDTVYLLSDGLPNLGEGLTAQQTRDLSELQRGEALGKHVLKTLKTDWNKALAARARVKINTIGFFYESPDLGAFLWALARGNDGSFVGMSKP